LSALASSAANDPITMPALLALARMLRDRWLFLYARRAQTLMHTGMRCR